MGVIKAKKNKHALRKFLVIFGILLILLVTAILIFLFPVMRVNEFRSLDSSKLSIKQPAAATVYDNDNNEIMSFDSPSVSYYKIPKYTINAFIASEDKKFFKHNGIDRKRILGAAWRDIKSGKAKEGASTISQQVVKNTHLTGDKTIRRKLEEIKLAKELEDKYSKEKILEIYLNRIYFGGGSFGIEAASINYFGKPAEQLTLSESAMLAGIIPSPQNYSPRAALEKALERRGLVLKLMLEDGYITEAEYETAQVEKIDIRPEKRAAYQNNNYLNCALSEAAKLTGLPHNDFAQKNYKIYTYMDKAENEILENAIKTRKLPENEYKNVPDILGVLIDNPSGGVRAFYGQSKYDLITIKRQPASAIKPVLVYAPALENNTVSESSIINDEPSDFNGYKPRNYNDKYYGEITARYAVETSSNNVAVKVLEYEGLDYAKKTAAKAGIEFSEKDDTLALALGGFTEGITPLSLCGSYSVFARGGQFKKPSFIKAIYGPSGNLIYKNDDKTERVFGEDTAYIMTDILKGAVKRGTAKKLSPLPFEVAAKTGTSGTEDGKFNNDAYCISYTSRHTLGVWMGNSEGGAEHAMVKQLTGGGLPATVSRAVYENIYENALPPDFIRPASVVTVGNKLYAERYAPKPDIANDNARANTGSKENTAGRNPAQLPRPLDRERIDKTKNEKLNKHNEKYERLKNETEEKKKNFIARIWDKMRKLKPLSVRYFL